jgi:hypothetical protein
MLMGVSKERPGLVDLRSKRACRERESAKRQEHCICPMFMDSRRFDLKLLQAAKAEPPKKRARILSIRADRGTVETPLLSAAIP